MCNVYVKGEFKGMIFVVFKTPETRNRAIALFKEAGLKEGASAVWAKPNQKLEERVVAALVFGTKRIVDKSLWADPQTGIVTLAGELVLQGKVVNGSLEIVYGAGWEEYLFDTGYPEFKELLQALAGKLSKGSAKGKGKFARKCGAKGNGKGV